MTNYDNFAKHYDTIMGDREKSYTRIIQFIENYYPQAKTVLELGSGTGSVLKGLSKHYQVTGIELSPEMLKLARQKVPQATLHHGDITTFKLTQAFDVILCVYDTINHLITFNEWELVFKQAYKHLKENGLFIFDINTLGRLELLSKQGVNVVEFNSNIMEMTVQKVNNNTYNWDITVFNHEHTKLYKETIVEVSFPINQISAALLTTFDLRELFTLSDHKPDDLADKAVYFICKKKL